MAYTTRPSTRLPPINATNSMILAAQAIFDAPAWCTPDCTNFYGLPNTAQLDNGVIRAARTQGQTAATKTKRLNAAS